MAFSMEIADPNAVKQEVVEQVKPSTEELTAVNKSALDNVSEIMKLDLDTSFDEKRKIVGTIDSFGMDTIESSAKKSQLLQVSVGNLGKLNDGGGVVAKSLLDLKRVVKDLDPSPIDFTKTGMLGKIFNPIRNYFARFEKADDVIGDIVKSLDKGRVTLKNDNTTLELEEQSLRELTQKLMKQIDMATAMDTELSRQIEAAEASAQDPDKIKFIKDEILFPLRQRLMDMEQMTVVNQQGIIAMEVVVRNNKELIRGVDRAKNVTISALRTATIVASALYNQNIVMKKIDALNSTTENIISTTSKMLKEQGTEIHRQALNSNISVDTLKAAFQDAVSAMDDIDMFREQALPQMAETVKQFRELADTGEQQVKKIEQRRALTGDSSLTK